MKVNLAIALPSIAVSRDRTWLTTFRGNVVKQGESEIVAAIDHRIAELKFNECIQRVGTASLANLSLAERVQEAVRVYEVFLSYKHDGKRIAASRTRTMIKRRGEKEALVRTVQSSTMSAGLELLAKHKRLDCAYEQIILDFRQEFEPELVAKARQNLAAVPGA